MKRAICNELFGDMDFAESCRLLQQEGYQGIEIAPFTLFEDPGQVTPKRIGEIKRIISDHGLTFAGFHWLFLTPKGLHITTPEEEVRRRSWDHLKRLVDLAGELGGGVLVLGSPGQRSARQITVPEAITHLQQGLSLLADFAAERHCSILLESLSSEATDVINTMAEAQELIRRVSSKGVQGIFDFHNCSDETEEWPELIHGHASMIRHVHLNELNGSYPGTGDSDFVPAFRALAEIGYQEWVSLEIFHVPEDPVAVLSATGRFLDQVSAGGP